MSKITTYLNSVLIDAIDDYKKRKFNDPIRPFDFILFGSMKVLPSIINTVSRVDTGFLQNDMNIYHIGMVVDSTILPFLPDNDLYIWEIVYNKFDVSLTPLKTRLLSDDTKYVAKLRKNPLDSESFNEISTKLGKIYTKYNKLEIKPWKLISSCFKKQKNDDNMVLPTELILIILETFGIIEYKEYQNPMRLVKDDIFEIIKKI